MRAFGLLTPDRTPCGQPLALSHAHGLMELLQRHETQAEPLKLGDLALALGLDKSNAGRLARRMATAGHVQITTSREDRRARCVQLTPAGLRLARQVDAASRERFDRLLSLVPSGERESVIQVAETLASAASALADEVQPTQE